MRKFITLLAGLALVIHLSACTSKKSDEEAAPDGADQTAAVDSELEKVDGADAAVAADGQAGNPEGLMDEQLPETALGEKKDEAPPADGQVVADAPPADPSAVSGVDTGSEPPPVTADSTPTVSEPAPDAAAMASTDDKPKAPASPLRKVESVPFRRDGVLLNAVYIARPKDTYKTISKMIYGDESKAKELKKVNGGKSVKPSEKIYYNSPTRATDETKIANYYEDIGMTPEKYVAQEGDNLKKISKNLLGYDNAWKEIWSTNQTLESKGKLTAGTEIVFWKGAASAGTPGTGTNIASNTGSPAPELPPPPPEANVPPPTEAPVPPPAEAAAPPPPPAPDLPPPPPPMEAQAPPPPPPPAAMPKKQAKMDEGAGMDSDMMMTLGIGGGLIVLVAGFIIMRKRKQQREMAAAFNDTQVGT